ncbi:MAG: hypothetical protein AB1810_14155 [Pseudomonadota bacterium]
MLNGFIAQMTVAETPPFADAAVLTSLFSVLRNASLDDNLGLSA